MFVKQPYNPEGDELSGRTVAIIAITIILALAASFWLQRGGLTTPPAVQQQGQGS